MFVSLGFHATTSQWVIASIFMAMGVLHFAVPKPFVAIMPKWIPRERHRLLVHVSGLAEFLGGSGVLFPGLRPWAGAGLLLLLVAVFPANVQMLQNARAAKKSAFEVAALWARLPLQAVLLWWVWTSTLA